MSEEKQDLHADLAAVFDDLHTEAKADEAPKDRGERDDKGRFKPKQAKAEEEESTETPAVEETPEEEITDQGDEPAAEPASQPLAAPDRWSAEWKAKFTALPREAQQLLLEREGEYDKGFTQKSQEAADYKRRYEPIEQILAPRRHQLAMQGMNEQQALTQLFALSDFATEKPVEFLQMFASQRGINLAQLNQPQAAQAPSELTPVLNKVQALEQMIARQQADETTRQINAFKAAPGHEHFEDVRTEMARMMTSGIATDMQDAYEKACRVNANVYAKIESGKLEALEARKKADEAKRIDAQKQAALKARKAAGTSISAKSTLNGGAPAPASMRESMNAEFDRLMGA